MIERIAAGLLRSWVAWTLAAIYLVAAALIIRWEIRNTGGGFINMRQFGTDVMTAPSQLLLGPVFRALGVPKMRVDDPRVSDYTQIVVHVLVTAVLVYAVGWGLESLARRLLSLPVSGGAPSP